MRPTTQRWWARIPAAPRRPAGHPRPVSLVSLLLLASLALAGNRSCAPLPLEAFCDYGGQTYAPGESFPALDGCNSCFCGEDGSVACTKMACVPGGPGVFLWVDQVAYPALSEVHASWWNQTDEPIYLAGCATFTVQTWRANTWVDEGPTVHCFWEGVAVKVTPFDIHHDFATATARVRHRLRGEYWRGCMDGEPISQARCTEGPVEVFSRPFETFPAN